MKALSALLVAALVTLALSLAGGPGSGASAGPRPEPGTLLPLPPPDAAPRVRCPRSRALRLRRFEDGSAQLRCGRRVLVRVAVPG